MTDNEKTDLKERISDVIKSRIDQNGHIDRNELRELFKNNLAVLDSLIEELKDGQVIKSNLSGRTYLSGLKFKSFKTYRQFIDEINNPKPTVVKYEKHWYDTPIKVVGFISLVSATYFGISDNYNENNIHELTNKTNRQIAIIDSLSKEVHYRDSLLLTERAKLKTTATDSLDKGVK